MNSFLVFIIIILIIILFLGVINPKVEINKSTRLKVFLVWLFFAFIVTIIAIPKNNVRKSDFIEEASSLIENGEYSEAKRILLKVKEDNKYYIDAKGLIKKSDSLKMIDERAKIEAKEIEKETILKESIQNQIQYIDEFPDYSMYRGSIGLLEGEIGFFKDWGDLIRQGERSEDPEIQELVKRFKPKVEKVQIREFPIMRKEYAIVANKLMWENNIEVSSSGTGHKYITFTGGVFANNKNIKDFHNEISNVLRSFRFSKVYYKWYKGAEEYSSGDLYEGNDSDLVN